MSFELFSCDRIDTESSFLFGTNDKVEKKISHIYQSHLYPNFTHTHYNRVACFLPFLFVAFNWIVMKVMALFGKKIENPVEEVKKGKIQENGTTCCTSTETKGDNRMKID